MNEEDETISAGEVSNHSNGSGIPKEIGPFRIRQTLGEGGFGVVYDADQSKPVKRRVALKVIKPGMDSAAVLARFEAERQALAVMDHPCIAKVLDAGMTDLGRPYFAMELVRGEPITDFCDRNRIALKDRLRLFMRVCDAIQHAHTKGVIHRDLKPSNILVAYRGDEIEPKVIDFGVAKALNQKLSENTIFTHQGQLIGTPEYMSPEQAEMGATDIDTRSDVYSLGVVLYELLTGARPFEPETLRKAGIAEIQRIIRESEPPKPSTRLASIASHADDPESVTRITKARRTEIKSLTSTLRRDLDWVVMKCLEKDRSRRYDTASELESEISRYLNDEPVIAGPPDVRYRIQKFAKRNKSGIVFAGVLASLLFSSVLILGFVAAWAIREKSKADFARDEAEAALEQVELEELRRKLIYLKSDFFELSSGELAAQMNQVYMGYKHNELANPYESALVAGFYALFLAEENLPWQATSYLDEFFNHITVIRESFEQHTTNDEYRSTSLFAWGELDFLELVEDVLQVGYVPDPVQQRVVSNEYIDHLAWWIQQESTETQGFLHGWYSPSLDLSTSIHLLSLADQDRVLTLRNALVEHIESAEFSSKSIRHVQNIISLYIEVELDYFSRSSHIPDLETKQRLVRACQNEIFGRGVLQDLETRLRLYRATSLASEGACRSVEEAWVFERQNQSVFKKSSLQEYVRSAVKAGDTQFAEWLIKDSLDRLGMMHMRSYQISDSELWKNIRCIRIFIENDGSQNSSTQFLERVEALAAVHGDDEARIIYELNRLRLRLVTKSGDRERAQILNTLVADCAELANIDWPAVKNQQQWVDWWIALESKSDSYMIEQQGVLP